MQRRQLLFACLLAIAAALAAWWLSANRDLTAPPPVRDAHVDDQVGPSAAQPGGRDEPIRATARSRDDEPVAPRFLVVRLRGLHADAPWTSELRLELQDRSRAQHRFDDHVATAPIDAEARCRLELPSWWQPGRMVRLGVQGRQDGYRDVFVRQRGALTLAGELVLDVQPVATVLGHVHDAQGEPVRAARIAAYRTRDGQPIGRAVAETGSDERGAFRLLAPPDAELFVVAIPMRPQAMRWRRSDGVQDTGELHPSLLPSARTARLDIRTPRDGFDFVVPDAARVHGTVTHPDGRPAADARVHLTSTNAADANATNLDVSEHTTLTVLADGTLAVSGDVPTGDDGRFELPAAPGQQVIAQVLTVLHMRIVGNLQLHVATAPARVDVVLPFTTTVRAVHQDQLQPHARLVSERGQSLRFEKDGTRQLLVAEPTVVRADRGVLRSDWTALDVGDDHRTVDLQLTDSMVELAIEIEAEPRVRNATFAWQRSDGRRTEEARQRDDRELPFRLFVEPGTYRLRITAGPGERNGTFLLPIERTVTVASTPTRMTVQAKFGGRFACNVLDRAGRRLPGTVAVHGVDGSVRRAAMHDGGKPGVLHDDDVSVYADVLPPGPYRLVFDLGVHGVHERYVQIVAREVMPVSLQL
ncbi:MAG: hypothetical protein ACE37K_17805 [Planctomycetota bacterium]